jgi:alpha-tubulin N-acetyltransferase 1
MKLFNSDNKLYIKVDGNKAIGFLKVGKRNLFIRSDNGAIKEIKPLCVLDFYVHESVQRGGQGKVLFDLMLATENI